MKVTDAQVCLSIYGAGPAKRVEAIATVLRGAGLLPKGGRGPYAPEITAKQAALFTLAVAGSERVADATDVARILSTLVDQNGEILIDVLTDAVEHAGSAQGIHRVLTMTQLERPDASMAEVSYRSGDVERFFLPKAWKRQKFQAAAQGQSFVGRIGHIGGAVLHKMAIEFGHRLQPSYRNAERA